MVFKKRRRRADGLIYQAQPVRVGRNSGRTTQRPVPMLQDDMMEVSQSILSPVHSLLRLSFRSVQRRTGDDEGEMQRSIVLTIRRPRGRSVQVSKEHFKELLVTVFVSIAKSVGNLSAPEADTAGPLEAAPRFGLKLNSLFWLIDELWDDMRQLVSTEPKFLATCLLTREPFTHYVSTLQLISSVFNWLLSRWVPNLALKLMSIREDEEMWEEEEEDKEMEMIEESNFADYIRRWEHTLTCTTTKHCSFQDTSE